MEIIESRWNRILADCMANTCTSFGVHFQILALPGIYRRPQLSVEISKGGGSARCYLLLWSWPMD